MKKNRNFGFDPKELNALILSHAHIDHCGLLPKLVKEGFKGPIYCTPATKELLEIMLLDSAHIQESDFEFFQRHTELTPLPEDQPLYTEEDVRPVLDLLVEKKLHEEFTIGKVEIKAKFHGAGHIIGAALVYIEYEGKSFLFTGDLGREHVPMLKDADTPDADFILMESTYGGRKHEPVSLNRPSLVKVIKETAEKGGKVIIPSFALERTQEILYYLEEALKKNEIPQLNIYVDSPMATKVTNLFKRHIEIYDEEMAERYKNSIAFQNRQIVYTNSVEESKALNDVKFPCVIISASGMCEAGRIRHHLANNIENPNNTVLIVGYMAEHTLGRKLIEAYSPVNIFGKPYKVAARVEKLNSFSGHADEVELMHWLGKIQKKPKKVILVHGEEKAIEKMKENIEGIGLNAEIADFGKEIVLD